MNSNCKVKELVDAGPEVDFYLPITTTPTSTQKYIYIFTHGGAWITGKKSEFVKVGHSLAERGHPTAVLGYRLCEQSSLKNCFPAPYRDAAAGIEWVYRNAKSIVGTGSLDEVKLVLVGHSAGAHLNGMVALKDASGNKFGLSREAKAAIVKIISVEAIYDLDLLAESFPTYPAWFLDPVFPSSSSVAGHAKSKKWSDVSLCNSFDLDLALLNQDNPGLSFLSIYSPSDELVDEKQSLAFVEFMNSVLSSSAGTPRVLRNTSILESHDGILRRPELFDLIIEISSS